MQVADPRAALSGAPRKPASTHFSFIDTLRGSAAFFVAFFHIFLAMTGLYAERAPAGFNHFVFRLIFVYLDLGKFAVGLFFLVSGFLIPSALEGSRSLKTFGIHRFFRLYPAYWFSIAVLVGLQLYHAGATEYPPADVFLNLTMLQGFIGHPDISGVFWTLQIELTFYFLCALLFCFGLLRHRGPLALSFLVIAFLGSLLRWKVGKAVPEALLIALALMFTADGIRHKDRFAWLYFLLCALFIAPISYFAYGTVAARYLASYWLALFTFWLVASCNSMGFHRSLPVRFMADISYSLYLLHGIVGIDLALYLNSRGMNLWLALAIALAASIIASGVAYRLIEAPAIAFSRRLAPGRPKTA